MVKKALQKLWKDSCQVTEQQDYKRSNGSTGQREVIVIVKEPCKLSFEAIVSANQTADGAALVQKAKLLLDPDIVIKAGSKIVVTRRDKIFTYKQSGEPAVFTNHQEIMLELFEGWA